MIDLIFPGSSLSDLRTELHHDRLESAAILLAVPVRLPGNNCWRLLVKEVHVAPNDAYEERTPVAVRLKPDFGLPIEKKARQKNWSLIYCHTHPHQAGLPTFSAVDDLSEKDLAIYANSRNPGTPHLSLLLGRNRASARELGTALPARVINVGKYLQFVFDPDEDAPIEEMHDRQIRAFGKEGQQRLHRLRIGIVGLGGTGSIVVQQLAHLGVDNYILIDPDIIESTNLNRVVGALPADIGRTAKVEVGKRVIEAIRPNPRVETLMADITTQGIGRRLAEVDLIFCCTDSHASRHLINHIAYQFLIPVIDMGVAIDQQNDNSPAIWGHAKMLAPELPCLWCVGNIDPQKVREELMSERLRQADPYFNQAGVIQPAVISLTSTTASFAVTMFLSAVVGIPAPTRHMIYDANSGRVRPVTATIQQNCLHCSPTAMANGDDYPIPERAHD